MRRAMTAAAIAVGLFVSGLSASARPHDAAKPDPIGVGPSRASCQAPPAVPPVVTETRRREILQQASALTGESLSEVVRRAEAGDVEAQVLAGLAMERRAKGVASDLASAMEWTRRAAEAGHPVGQNSLGVAYQTGDGLPRDSQKAVEWYTKAAAQGYAQAQANLGAMHERGDGVPLDYAQALTWYRKAVEQDNAWAQYRLGAMYFLGRGVRKDGGEAVAWFRKAAEQGEARAQLVLGGLLAEGQGVRKDKAEAEKWFRKSSEQGFAPGSFNYGLINFEKAPPGRLDPVGTLVGVNAWKLSAEQGYPVAAFALGELYTGRMFRYHVTQDDLEACTWYAVASNLDREGEWEDEAVASMRKDLPGRIDKVRKSLGVTQYAECGRRASDWTAAHRQPRKQ